MNYLLLHTYSSASAGAKCFFFYVYLYHVYLHLQRDKPSCLKVIVVKIIYENFSLFFLETLTEKTPTDICGCGCRCSFVLMRLFVE